MKHFTNVHHVSKMADLWCKELWSFYGLLIAWYTGMSRRTLSHWRIFYIKHYSVRSASVVATILLIGAYGLLKKQNFSSVPENEALQHGSPKKLPLLQLTTCSNPSILIASTFNGWQISCHTFLAGSSYLPIDRCYLYSNDIVSLIPIWLTTSWRILLTFLWRKTWLYGMPS